MVLSADFSGKGRARGTQFLPSAPKPGVPSNRHMGLGEWHYKPGAWKRTILPVKVEAGHPNLTGKVPDLGPRAVEATPVLGSVLDSHQRRTTPLAANAKALSEAQHDEEHRCPDADRCVAWQQAHQHRRCTHEQQRRPAFGLRPILSLVVGEDHAAEGPGDKPGETKRKRPGCRSPDQRTEKTSSEDQGRGGAKMKKSYHSIVVPMRLAKATLRDERRDGPSPGSVRGVKVVSVFPSI